MSERARRLWAAAEAIALGHGGVAMVARATGMARSTIGKGKNEVRAGARREDVVNVRRSPGKRPFEVVHPEVWPALEKLVDPLTRGDPESPLRWTTRSMRRLSSALFNEHGIRVCDKTVSALLRAHKYSLQAPSKAVEGAQHPDRDAQFEHINRTAQDFVRRGEPAISVDTKKKELVGNFKNGGREWRPQGQPERVDVHDFISDAVGKAIPYGVYDVAADEGFVSVGVDHDTPTFAVASIKAWWLRVGSKRYPAAREFFITADAGGSNAARARGWKVQLRAPRRRSGAADPREPLPARDEQVEQDRAPALLVHLHQLARPTAAHLRDDHQPDRQHDPPGGPRGPRATRPGELPDGHEDLG
jgi:hypothetical protein